MVTAYDIIGKEESRAIQLGAISITSIQWARRWTNWDLGCESDE